MNRQNRNHTGFCLTCLTCRLHIFFILAVGFAYLNMKINEAQSKISEFEGSNFIERISNIELTSLKEAEIKRIIQKVIDTELERFQNDKTGKTDFALEIAGGKVVELSKGTENFEKDISLFGVIPLCEGINGPATMLQPVMYPGECWAFKGSKGGAIIQLWGTVFVDSVSLEHISRNMSPTGLISSAPKDFVVWAMDDATTRAEMLGQFQFNISGPSLQTFQILPLGKAYEYLEFQVLNNYGHQEYTCIYRFRVHGKLKHFRNGKTE